MENKKVKILGKIHFVVMMSPYDVIRHNVKSLLDLEITHKGISYEILYNMVPSISKFDLWVSNFRFAARTIKVKVDRPLKTNQTNGIPYATFTPSLVQS
jgi:hypothetical protein